MNISRIYRVYADGSIKPVDYLKSISAEDREKLYILYMDKLKSLIGSEDFYVTIYEDGFVIRKNLDKNYMRRATIEETKVIREMMNL